MAVRGQAFSQRGRSGSVFRSSTDQSEAVASGGGRPPRSVLLDIINEIGSVFNNNDITCCWSSRPELRVNEMAWFEIGRSSTACYTELNKLVVAIELRDVPEISRFLGVVIAFLSASRASAIPCSYGDDEITVGIRRACCDGLAEVTSRLSRAGESMPTSQDFNWSCFTNRRLQSGLRISSDRGEHSGRCR